ncbi:MAG TPA: RMD1 family protein [Acidocella sp.]|nr:RMD1 family protein [Acidocella sp.]
MAFRYGALVLFNACDAYEQEFLDHVVPLLTEPRAVRENDEARLRVNPAAEEQVDATGAIVIGEMNIERLQAIAIVLAKRVVLSHYELRLAAVFDRIDPLAADHAVRVRNRGRGAN